MLIQRFVISEISSIKLGEVKKLGGRLAASKSLMDSAEYVNLKGI